MNILEHSKEWVKGLAKDFLPKELWRREIRLANDARVDVRILRNDNSLAVDNRAKIAMRIFGEESLSGTVYLENHQAKELIDALTDALDSTRPNQGVKR
jgi:phosphatidylserine/phosphatidylglycerophosphate/cardiolipin synthase-like enzyme